jgi:hypothetical protein
MGIGVTDTCALYPIFSCDKSHKKKSVLCNINVNALCREEKPRKRKQ